MKGKIVYAFLALVLFLIVLSCNKDDGPDLYGTKFYSYWWNVDSMPLEISSSAYEYVFEGKDREGNSCDVYIDAVGWKEKDTMLQAECYRLDTVRVTSWFTAINEKNKRIRVTVDENTSGNRRLFILVIGASHTVKDRSDGYPDIGDITLIQAP